MRYLCSVPIRLYFSFFFIWQITYPLWLLCSAAQNAVGFFCIEMSLRSCWVTCTSYNSPGQLLCCRENEENCTAGKKVSANLCYQEMLGETCLLSLFSDGGIQHFCKALNILGAFQLLWPWGISQGSSAPGRTEPRACSGRGRAPALILFKEKTITEAGRTTQSVKWNKCGEYMRNREWQSLQKARMKEGGWLVASLMATLPQLSLLQSLPPSVCASTAGSLLSGL